MRFGVILAARGGPGAKSRSAAVLGPVERARLVELLLQDAVAVLASAPSVGRIHVVTPDLAAPPPSMRIAQDGPGGLSAAFDQARALIRSHAPVPDRLLFLPCDLPLLTTDAVERLAWLGRRSPIAIVPAMRDGGTNALLLDPALAFEFAFGPDSLRRHQVEAHALGIDPVVFIDPAIGIDLDDPDDARRVGLEGTGRRASFLRERLPLHSAPIRGSQP